MLLIREVSHSAGTVRTSASLTNRTMEGSAVLVLIETQAYRRDHAFSFSYYIIKFDFLYVLNSNQLFSFHHRLISIRLSPPLVSIRGSIIDHANLGFFDRECKAADFDDFFTDPKRYRSVRTSL